MSKRLHTQDTTGSTRRRLNDSTDKRAPELSALDARATIYFQKLREWMEADRYAAFVKAFRTTLPAEIRNVIQFYVLPRFPRPEAPTAIDLSKPYHPPPSLQVSRATRHAAAEAYYASNIFSVPDAKTAFTFLSSLDPEHRALIRHFRFAPRNSRESLPERAHTFVRLWHRLWFHNVQLEPNVLKMWIPRYWLPQSPSEVPGIWTATHDVISMAWFSPTMREARRGILQRRLFQAELDRIWHHWTRGMWLEGWQIEEGEDGGVGATGGWAEFDADWEQRFEDEEGEVESMGGCVG
ncbi:hypothetical protein B0A48_14046 [Cryoendolithus antarcticus]|uniref:Uncharacterized protein n=1 Tax=Cryoendolithus antarcticus TaxID=1507870 RepID=A0A1V8SMB1_9PEZI|nr:hypothetical protein B0A48_14046 [Cryoendolithus antarcticus]